MLLEILSVIGSICLFLYGMRVVSDSLQKLSGRKMRAAVHSLTNTRGRGFLSGFFITSLIQTSSASTLLVVSLVNAGVITLSASLPMIIGANVGTTVKLWFISFLGFQFDITGYALVLIAVGFPFLFFKSGNLKNLGEFLVGFALLFLGLIFMKSVFPPADEYSVFFQWVQNTSQAGFPGVLLFIFLGFAITAIIQSSSAAITLTFVLCYSGVIGFPMAAAMVLGQNIGTTITVNLGALVANSDAKKSAFSHLLMNLITVIVFLPFFNQFTRISQELVQILFSSDMNDPHQIPVGLAFVHTMFNLVLAFIMLPSVKLLIRITEKVLPASKTEEHKLKILEDNFFSTSEILVLNAKTEIIRFAVQIKKKLNLLPVLLTEKKEKRFLEIQNKIQLNKNATDVYYSEIHDYLAKISERDLSREGSRATLKMLEITDGLQTISELAHDFFKSVEEKNIQKAWFDQNMRENLMELFTHLYEAIDILIEFLSEDFIFDRKNDLVEMHERVMNLITMNDHLFSEKNMPAELPPNSLVSYKKMLHIIQRISEAFFHISLLMNNSEKMK
jgi:phosphate:Na+ symporter